LVDVQVVAVEEEELAEQIGRVEAVHALGQRNAVAQKEPDHACE
jgi:hypothetical protein